MEIQRVPAAIDETAQSDGYFGPSILHHIHESLEKKIPTSEVMMNILPKNDGCNLSR